MVDIVWKIILEGKRFFFTPSFDFSDFFSSSFSLDELFSFSSCNKCVYKTLFHVSSPIVISHTYQILYLVRCQSFDQFRKCLIVKESTFSISVNSALVIFDQFLDKSAILFEYFITHVWDIVENRFILHLGRKIF